MLANSIANYVRTLAFVGDTQIRAAALEATEPRGIMVMAPLAGFSKVGEIEKYVSGNLQLIIRDKDPIWGDDMARKLIDALEVIGTPRAVENYSIVMMRSRGEPIMYPVNDAGLFEHSINFNTRAYRL